MESSQTSSLVMMNVTSEKEGEEGGTSMENPLMESTGSFDDMERLYASYSKGRAAWVFPVYIEKKLKWFDDPIISFCQRFEGKWWRYFSLFCTGLVSIELGIASPLVLFILGYDGLATEFVYLALLTALISQIPKRFVWRFRPYMVNRAKMVKKDKTSSLPSRAVTCATVYSFAVIWGYMYKNMPDDGSIPFEWWMPLLFLFAILISSFARINLGAHYPSDCVAGIIQGTIVCLIGTAFWKGDTVGCSSCRDRRCYSQSPDSTLTLQSLDHINILMVLLVFGFSLLIPLVSVVKPIDFWSKCDRVYGMLFPGIAFQLLFLCPNSTNEGFSLSPPPRPEWYDFLFAIAVAAIATGIGARIQGRRPIFVYLVLYSSLLFSLSLWRLNGGNGR